MIMKSGHQPVPQVYYLAELTAAQIRALDRDKTVVFLPGGILEEHGPYLPCFTDGYINERLACDFANAIASRPEWTVIIFPTIPLGTGGANEIGEKYNFPGTYAVRTTTLRAVFMDLADELGEQGFRWIFIVHFHGAPNQNKALDQACAYFNDTYAGWMLNLTGLILPSLLDARYMTEEDQKAAGLDVHAGTWETSWMLFLQPDLVDPAYQQAVPHKGKSWDDLIQIAKAPDWPGYFGSPSNSKAPYGKLGIEKVTEFLIALIFKVLDEGELDFSPRYAEIMQKSASNVAIDNSALEEEVRRQNQQNEWLKKHGL